LRELRALFARDAMRVIDLSEAGIPESDAEEGIEIFETFEENARAKSEYFHRLSGLPVFADDSGLVVHSLGGVPGVRSKRWSGRTDLSGHALDEANNAKLVAALQALSVSDSHMVAEYVCAAAFTDGEGSIVCLGCTEGYMTTEPFGVQGFGYDSYFHSSELGKSFGEASTEEKLRVSHRGRAFEALLGALRASGRISG
jgi:XTP/dITP diphosphohydrolase